MNIQIENGIDRNTCDQLRTALKELLDPIESTGLSYEVGRIKYDNVNMKVSIEFFIKEGKEEQDKDIANQWLEIYDAKFRVGDEISYDGETYTIIGYKPKARKGYAPVSVTSMYLILFSHSISIPLLFY